jgi:hypothetical protein
MLAHGRLHELRARAGAAIRKLELVAAGAGRGPAQSAVTHHRMRRRGARALLPTADDLIAEHVTGHTRNAESGGRFRHGHLRLRLGRVASLTKWERFDGERPLVHAVRVCLRVQRRSPFARDLHVALLASRVLRLSLGGGSAARSRPG